MEPFYTVVCTDVNDYVNWQFELLEYSWSRIHQRGELVRLVSGSETEVLPVARHACVIRTRPTSVHPVSGDVYKCYNRLYSLAQWLDEYEVDGTILIVDPDVVFRTPVRNQARAGLPVGQHWIDFGISTEFAHAIDNVCTIDHSRLQHVTWPAQIHSDDLRKILPRWISLTVAIREQTRRQECDMFAFVIAAAEAGIDFRLEATSAFMPWPDALVGDAPLIHYCQPVVGRDGSRIWYKQDYQPWERVPVIQKPTLRYCRDLIRLINEYAGIRHAENTHLDDTIFIAIASYCEPELVDTINSCLQNARAPQNLRFGICHQFDNNDPKTSENSLDVFSQDRRIRYVAYPFEQSRGGCWARNIAQQLYDGETYTLQIDSHTRMIESWDTILIRMLRELPGEKPLITEFPPLYFVEDGIERYDHIEDFSMVNTYLAERWVDDGWLQHTQTLIPENNVFPRRTRLLSGAFVFTLGKWNTEVMQDPQHFYTGEEFALALRSYTSGYDLFDPGQIVAWHRCHPEPNRKYCDDNSDEATAQRHRTGIHRLQLLLDGDPDGDLGEFSLGDTRSLEDYRQYAGIDCLNKTVDEDAKIGVRPGDPVASDTAVQSKATMTPDTAETSSAPAVPQVDVTVYLSSRQPLLLSCSEDTPVLITLFSALKNRMTKPDDVVFLNIGAAEAETETILFRQSELVSIETSPALGEKFFSVLETPAADTGGNADGYQSHQPELTQTNRIPDDWKTWIWHNVGRGSSKDNIFKQLIEQGFSWAQVRDELGYQPTRPLDQIEVLKEEAGAGSVYQTSPVATRVPVAQLEMYYVDNFLEQDECDDLISIIRARLRPSTIVGEQAHSNTRTSRTCLFDFSSPESALTREVTARVCRLAGINPRYAEPTQGQVYGPGEEYKAHNDWFAPGTPDFEKEATEASGGQRTWSVVVYLNAVAAGGETEFPRVGVTVQPERGKLVFWNNIDQYGVPTPDALHRSCPVLEGEKYVLTLWFRSLGSGAMYIREPWEQVPRYTENGFHLTHASADLQTLLAAHYAQASAEAQSAEHVDGGYLQSANNTLPSSLLEIPLELEEKITAALQPMCEAWCGESLLFSAIYGIRTYHSGASLRMHTDTDETHIISAIVNVSQRVNTDWALQIEDHMFRRHAIVLKPGEILLYEGARLTHGRPTPLDGEHFANIFVHFRPRNY